MKKALWVPIAIVCLLLGIVGVDMYSRIRISSHQDESLICNDIYTRNSCDYAMDKVITEDTMVVLGSSELAASDDLAYPQALFNGGHSDFNILLTGAAFLQSLPQAVDVGAFQNNIKNGKIVLIVSPQWFRPGGLTSDEYCSRFEESNYIEFLQNDDIKTKTKKKVAKRINELLVSDPPTLERVKKDEKMYLEGSVNPLSYLEMTTYNWFRNAKRRYDFAGALGDMNSDYDRDKTVNVEEIDWKKLLADAEEVGKQSCTNNDYGIIDEYWDEYVRDVYDSKAGEDVTETFTISPEFEDLNTFIEVCRETKLEPLIICVPVNGRWYDYWGHSKSDRNTYYQSIRNICKEQGVALADFSDKEYELYFLRDIMHMGWKGWAYLDKAVYDFYKTGTVTDDTIYEEIKPVSTTGSAGATVVSDGSYQLKTDVADNAFSGIYVDLPVDGTPIDDASYAGHREGTYLHQKESGECVIRVRAASTLQDEYVDLTYHLEKDAVYKIEYDVETLDTTSASVNNLVFSKITYK